MSFKLTLSKKIIFQAVVLIVCFSLVLTWVFFRLKGNLYQEKISATRQIVEVGYSLLADFDARVQKGELNLEEAQKRAIEGVKNLRYD